MKKLLLIIITLLLSICSVFAFTDEEFYEVYDQLVVSNEMLKQQAAEIVKLNKQINLLVTDNVRLIDELNTAKAALEECKSTLLFTQETLDESKDVINILNNQNWIVSLGLSCDFNQLRFGAAVGRKLFLTTFLFGGLYFNGGSIELNLSYGILF